MTASTPGGIFWASMASGRVMACVTALAFSAATIINSPMLCRDDGLPRCIHQGVGCPDDPCAETDDLPGEDRPPLLCSPAPLPVWMPALPSAEPDSADAPAPPTPPPTPLI